MDESQVDIIIAQKRASAKRKNAVQRYFLQVFTGKNDRS